MARSRGRGLGFVNNWILRQDTRFQRLENVNLNEGGPNINGIRFNSELVRDGVIEIETHRQILVYKFEKDSRKLGHLLYVARNEDSYTRTYAVQIEPIEFDEDKNLKHRVISYFPWFDASSSARIYEKIQKLDGKFPKSLIGVARSYPKNYLNLTQKPPFLEDDKVWDAIVRQSNK